MVFVRGPLYSVYENSQININHMLFAARVIVVVVVVVILWVVWSVLALIQKMSAIHVLAVFVHVVVLWSRVPLCVCLFFLQPPRREVKVFMKDVIAI